MRRGGDTNPTPEELGFVLLPVFCLLFDAARAASLNTDRVLITRAGRI